jgi:hypothetical protein
LSKNQSLNLRITYKRLSIRRDSDWCLDRMMLLQVGISRLMVIFKVMIHLRELCWSRELTTRFWHLLEHSKEKTILFQRLLRSSTRNSNHPKISQLTWGLSRKLLVTKLVFTL